MGVVFKARQLSMDRIVAIKFLPKKLAQDERIVARFLREARAAGQLAHPNIVSVHELGLADGLHFIAMEYVDGNSIQKRLKEKGPFSEKDTLEIALQIAEALKLAHSRGILHRDIKPDNFLIDSAHRVRLADLGLALIQSNPDGGLTLDGTTLGTPHFMAPEQCSGSGVDARSDLYSLGASMFVMATGRTPYEGTTATAVMVKVLTEPPLSMKQMRPDLSPGFIALIEKMMHADPTKRFQDAASAAEAIQQCKSGLYKGVSVAKSSTSTKTPSQIKAQPGKPYGSSMQESVPGTRLLKPTESKVVPLLLGAGAAIILLTALFFWSHGKQSTPVIAHANTVVSTTVKSAPFDPRVPVAVAKPETDPKPADADIEKHTRLRKPFRETIRDMLDDLKADKLKYWVAQRKLDELQTTLDKKGAVASELRPLINKMQRDIHDKQRAAEEDWKKLDANVNSDLKDGHVHDALVRLSDFQTQNEGSDEAARAGERIDGMCSGVLVQANKLAANGSYKDARTLLSGIAANVPEKQEAAFKAKIAMYDEQIKLVQDLADCYERATAKVLYFDPVSKTRFQFLEGAKSCVDSASKARTNAIRKELLDMAELFKAADKIFATLRGQLAANPVELASLDTYKNVKVTQWDDKKLMYSTRDINQPQPFSWEKQSAPEAVFQVARELKKADLEKPDGQWELGVLAFALGNQSVAGKHIRDAVAKEDSPFKTQAAVVLKLIKPAESAVAKPEKIDKSETVVTSFEDDAKSLFKELQDAKKADNKEKIKAIRADFFDGKYLATEFFRTHKKEINDLSTIGAAVEPPKTPNSTKAVADKANGDTLPSEEKDAHEFLKKLGWTEIIGTWTWDKDNRVFRVPEGVSEVANPALECDVVVQFKMLDAGSKIRVLGRTEKGTMADRFAQFGGKTSLGFGADVNNEYAFVYLDWNRKAGSSKDPVQYPEIKIEQPRAFNTVQLSIHGKKMSVYINSKECVSAGDARPTGDTRVIVQGPMVLSMLKITNAK